MKPLSLPRKIVFLLALLGILASLYQLREANSGLTVTRSQLGPTPVEVFRGNAFSEKRKPVVVISHGFAGSQQLMQSFATTLAKNGYLAVTFDYFGHGANGQALSGDVTQVEGATETLLAQTREVVDFAVSLPDADESLALLGHSMASDIIVRFAQRYPDVDATIAVSMFSPAVTAESPQNLLVIVGGLEGFLKEEALKVLEMVTDDATPDVTVMSDSGAGARRVSVAEGVEHVGVLYSAKSMTEATHWLEQRLDQQLGDTAKKKRGYIDHRGPWIMLLLLGVGALAWPLATFLPAVSHPPQGASLTWKRLIIATSIPAIATPLLLAKFPADFLGVLVGGYLAVHFLLYGLISTACAIWLYRGAPHRITKPQLLPFSIAIVCATLYCAVLVSMLLDAYVTSFAITTLRVPLLIAMFVGTLCYFTADEWLAHGEHSLRGGHFVTRVAFLLSIALAVALSFEELFFLVIIAGVIVIYFLVYGLFSRWIYQATGHPLVGAVANALAFAWALAAVFPFMSG